MKKINKKGGAELIVLGIVVLIIAGIIYFGFPLLSAAGEDAPWADKLVDFQLLTTDRFSSADESATVKVYAVQPEDWLNPRGDFSDAADYTSYTASSGVVTINKETPGTYYAVGTVSGSNTEFAIVEIPDGTGMGELYDYNQEPDSKVMDFSAVGSTTDEDFAFTNTNQTTYTVRDTITLPVGADTELRGWKVIVTDTEGYSIDADGDGVYDEGIKEFEVSVCGVSKTFFKPATGIDLLDSNDEYTFTIENCNVIDLEDVDVKVDIVANTADLAAANDELWGEGEGVLAYIKIYDNEGNLFATVDVAA